MNCLIFGRKQVSNKNIFWFIYLYKLYFHEINIYFILVSFFKY